MFSSYLACKGWKVLKEGFRVLLSVEVLADRLSRWLRDIKFRQLSHYPVLGNPPACSFSSENASSHGTVCAWTFSPNHQRYGKDYSTESFRDNSLFLFFFKQRGFLLAESWEFGGLQTHSCSCVGCRIFSSGFKDNLVCLSVTRWDFPLC